MFLRKTKQKKTKQNKTKQKQQQKKKKKKKKNVKHFDNVFTSFYVAILNSVQTS